MIGQVCLILKINRVLLVMVFRVTARNAGGYAYGQTAANTILKEE